MLRFVLFETTAFSEGDDRNQTESDLCWLLEGLTQRNQDYLRQRPNTVRIYKSGVVWEKPKQFDGECAEVKTLRDALGRAAKQKDVKIILDKVDSILSGEHFCDIGVILELKAIDCDGLACWRAAELRQMGIPARPMMTSRKRPDGGTTYHAIVRWPPFGDELGGNQFEESDEDPSLLLGMAQPQRKAERDEEIRKNIERCDYIRRCRARGIMPGGNYNNALEDVLGLRAGVGTNNALEAAIERMLSGASR